MGRSTSTDSHPLQQIAREAGTMWLKGHTCDDIASGKGERS